MDKSIITIKKIIPLIIVAALAVGCSGAGGGGTTGSTQTQNPLISPDSGEITNSTAISISAEEGAVVYYTTDGTDPTSESAVYSEAFTLPADVVSQTVKAVAVLDGLTNSDVVFEDYLVSEGVAAVTFADASGALPDNVDIVLSTATVGATIYYTVNGDLPTVESDVYSAPFTMASLSLESVTVKAFAVLDGYADSAVASAEYTKAVAEEPASDRADGETISDTMTVALSTGTVGAVIYYTTGGDEPTAASTLYTAPFTLPVGSSVVKAIAVLDGYADSSALIVNLTVEAQAEVPTISESSGFLAAGSTVTLSTAGDETIYYTLDGSDPTVSDSRFEYSGAFAVDSSSTLRAYAAGDGYYPSAEAAADYYVYDSIAGLSADVSALAAVASDGSLAVRAGGTYHDLVSGAFSARTLTVSEPAGDVLDFTLGDSGLISALYLVGTDIIYWTSADGAVAAVNNAAVSLADARILLDSAGNARIVFAQYFDADNDEVVEVVYGTSGPVRTSTYELKTRANGLDAVLDSSDTLFLAASDVKNTTSSEIVVIAWDEEISDWNLVKDWTNKAANPALAVRSDDSLVLGYVNPVNTTKTRFVVHDIAAAADLISINGFDTSVDGDTNLALDAGGFLYAASQGYGWRIDDGAETSLTVGTAPYRLLADPSGAENLYLVTTADLALYSID